MKRNIFTRPWVLLLGIIAIGVISGFSLAGCKQDSDPAILPGGGIPPALLGAWYWDYDEDGTLSDGEAAVPAYTFKEDGFVLIMNDTWSNGVSYTVSGNKIKQSGTIESMTFTISEDGKKLTLEGSDASHSGFAPGTYFKK